MEHGTCQLDFEGWVEFYWPAKWEMSCSGGGSVLGTSLQVGQPSYIRVSRCGWGMGPVEQRWGVKVQGAGGVPPG